MMDRVFAQLLRLLPRSFRDDYGADMRAAFRAKSADARARGSFRYARFVVREIAGLVTTSVSARLPRRAHYEPESDRRKLGFIESARREVRHATRRLVQTPGFAAACVITLALAIGANVAIFTVVHRVVLSPLPFEASDRLFALDHAAPGVGLTSGLGMSSGLYREYATSPAVEAIALYRPGEATVTGLGDAERVPILLATPTLDDVLRRKPALGRWFSDVEGVPGAPDVVLLSHNYWTQRFGSDKNVIGRSVSINGRMHDVIGVMPRAFSFPDDRAQLIVPLQFDPQEATPAGFNFQGIARLASGVDAAAARRALNAIIADAPRRFPAYPEMTSAMTGQVKLSSLAQPQKSFVLGDIAQTLWVVLGAVLVVLLIACVNLANLFMARAEARQRELAVRKAMGASRGEIAGLFLSESLLIVTLSAGAGVVLAAAAVRALVLSASLPIPRLAEIRLGVTEIGFAFAVAAVAGIIFGIIPFAARAPAIASVLQDAGRGNSASRGRMRARQTLMATQVALALMLLVAAGLMTQSFLRIQRIDPGFESESRLIFRIGLPESRYATHEEAAQFQERFLERIRALPRVEEAAFTTLLPLEGEGSGDPLDVDGRVTAPGALNPVVRYRRVSAEYFDVLDVPLRAGRFFTAAEAAGGGRAVIVDEALAALYFPGEEAIGKRIRMMQGGGYLTIVGVVANSSSFRLNEDAPLPKLYAPIRVVGDGENGLGTIRSASFVVRTQGDPVALVADVRRALLAMDESIALARPERFTDLVDRTQAGVAMTMLLLVIAGSVSLLIGLIGVYAVISFSVGQRAGEIGVRLALGARPGDVARMILRQSSIVILVGIAAGLAGAVAGARVLQSLLYGVTSRDPLTLAAVACALFAVAMIASSIPAWRAARQNPLDSLRT